MRKTFLTLILLAITSAAFAGFVTLGKGFGHGAHAAPVNCSAIPLTCPLVQSNSGTFTFLGSFTAPASFAYYGGAMSVSGTTLYMSGLVAVTGNSACAGIGSMTIPTLSGPPKYDGSNGAATTVTAPMTHVDGGGNPLINWGGGTNCGGTDNLFTGSLVYGGTLYLTGGKSYDASATATKWIVSAPTNLSNTGWGIPNAPSTAHGTYARFFAGTLGLVPAIWQPYIGGPAYVASGNGGLSITTSSPAGFQFSTFDPAAVSPSGGSVPLTELLDYYQQGSYTIPQPQMLSYRSFTGPFGSGTTYTLIGGNGTGTNGLTGATAATLSTGFSVPYPGEQPPASLAARFQICFSDSECRDVHLTPASSAIPDGLDGATFAALTCSPSCSTSVTIKPYGDSYLSIYDMALGYGFFVPGSSSFIYISAHRYGPIANRFKIDGVTGTSPCDPDGNSSSNNDAPWPSDTNVYRQLQVSAYKVQDLSNVKQGGQAVYTATPYANWPFPGWQNLLVSANPGQANGCIAAADIGDFFYDPATNILYGTVENSWGSGHNIIFEWQVNSL